MSANEIAALLASLALTFPAYEVNEIARRIADRLKPAEPADE